MDNQWFRGALGPRDGIFPKSFVEILVPLPPAAAAPPPGQTDDAAEEPEVVPLLAPAAVSLEAPQKNAQGGSSGELGEAVAIHTYESAALEDLEFREGERLYLVEAIDADWFRGKKRSGQEGLFPRSFVNVLREPGRADEGNKVVVALFDYKSDHPGDLPLAAGAEVELLEKVDADWLRGRRCADGVEGIFPATFVETVDW